MLPTDLAGSKVKFLVFLAVDVGVGACEFQGPLPIVELEEVAMSAERLTIG